jgi:hypothetical protein
VAVFYNANRFDRRFVLLTAGHVYAETSLGKASRHAIFGPNEGVLRTAVKTDGSS